jgi:hypothetical protein
VEAQVRDDSELNRVDGVAQRMEQHLPLALGAVCEPAAVDVKVCEIQQAEATHRE